MHKPSNFWTITSAVAAVAAVVFMIAFFLLGRQSKAMTVETISSASVADLSDPALSVLKLTYKNNPVSRVTAATIEVANTGTQPIEMRDFERPLVIRFGEPNSTLAVTLSKKEPQNLAPELTLGSSTITISPLLLNPGDRFRLNVVLKGDFNEPVVDSRIAGIPIVSRTMLRRANTAYRGILLLIFGALSIVAYGYLAIAFSPFSRHVMLLRRSDSLVIALILGAGSAMMTVAGASHLALSKLTIILTLLVMLLFFTCGAIVGAVRRNRINNKYKGRGTFNPGGYDDT